MKRAIRYITRDGVAFEAIDEATKYINRNYQAKLLNLTESLRNSDLTAAAFIDTNLDSFVDLYHTRADLEVINE